MSEAERGAQTTLFPAKVGARLRAAREDRGLSLAEVAARTRVPLRHLEAIEDSDFSRLPSATYAVGFVRSYARAVGADEVVLAADTRVEVANTVRATPQYEPYEVADPARVPSRTVTIVAAGLGLAILVLGILWFATGLLRGSEAPEAGTPVVAAAVPAAEPSVAPAPAGTGQVTLAATDEVWMRVYDAANETLYIGTMKPGERFDVPQGANNPQINVGRPDKLTVTLNGSALPPLGTGERAIKDVPVSAAALSARGTGSSAPTAQATSAPTSTRGAASTPPFFRGADRRSEPAAPSRQPAGTTPSAGDSAPPATTGAQAPPGAPAPAPREPGA